MKITGDLHLARLHTHCSDERDLQDQQTAEDLFPGMRGSGSGKDANAG